MYIALKLLKEKNKQTMKDLNLLDGKVLADRLLIEEDPKKEQVTAGGLILPDTTTETSASTGTILKVSGRVETDENEHDKIKVGDKVIFSKHAGTPLIFRGKEYKILRITDLLMVISQ